MGLKAIVVVPAINTQNSGSATTNVGAASGITIVVVNFAGASTVNLPPSPAVNQIVVVQDGSMLAATNNITVQGNGNNINIPTGVGTSYVIGENGTDAWFNWNGSAWGLLA
jgi:hypothetical protein